MKKLTPVQEETMKFCKEQIDKAREEKIDIKKVKKKERSVAQKIIDGQNGIVSRRKLYDSYTKEIRGTWANRSVRG